MAEQLLNGRYRLLRLLGSGGMASVYLAEDLRLGRRVAVKILHPQFAADPAFVSRFEQEARMAAALSHPNIVQIYDVGHEGDRHYIVMEYVEGETLKDVIAREGALPVPRALTVISGVLAALEFAHAHNLIHRDIKAQNILLTRDNTVKVTDFGIARDVGAGASPTLTATGMVIGTVQYFSPEQAQGRPATPQSDVYSAGIVFYEMLTGTLPFNAENPFAVAMQQINQPPPLPTRINASIPHPVEAIVLKALAKNPAERYAGAGEMKAAVDAVRFGAAEPTRVAPRTATATAPTRPAPGVIRTGTRPATQLNVQQRPAPHQPQSPSRGVWVVTLVLAAILAALLGAYLFRHPGFFGGGTATATPTPSPTVPPTSTNTPIPTATRPVVIIRPTHTPTETPTPTTVPTDTPTATALPATDTPTPSPTAPPTDTPVPTDTPTPTVSPSPAPTTPAPSGQVSLTLSPTTARPGDTITVIGNGWPDGATVTLSADFTETGPPQVLGRPQAQGGSFTAIIHLAADTSPGSYLITADDGQGNSTTANLTVTQ